jgi:hypothetical protein
MNVLIDVVDPGHRNEMMVLAIRRALFGELDFVGAVEMIDLADSLLVRRNDVHVFFDLRGIRHCGFLLKTARIEKRCDLQKVARHSF